MSSSRTSIHIWLVRIQREQIVHPKTGESQEPKQLDRLLLSLMHEAKTQVQAESNEILNLTLCGQLHAHAQDSGDEDDEDYDEMEKEIRQITSRVLTRTAETRATRSSSARRRPRGQEVGDEADRVELGADRKPKGRTRVHPANSLQPLKRRSR
ncbi:MAG: hypothetical protein Q9191_004568 [Dirinaria sp. TL-2023a]